MPNRTTLLENATRALEQVVTPPVVPGDVGPWAETVLAQLSDTLVALQSVEREALHTYDAIIKSSPGLSGRVDALRSDYDRVREQLAEVRGRLSTWIAEAADLDDSDEPVHALEEAREVLLAGITRLRAFEASLRTWLVEAVQRENGVGD